MAQKKSLNIHFVCLGNVYRSRFAEAYAKSKQTRHEFSSSGVMAEENRFGPVSWWGARLAYNAGVASYLSQSWVQTTQHVLDEADIVAFVHPTVETRAAQMFDLENVDYRVWNIEDLLPISPDVPEEQKEQESIRQSDDMAQQAMKNVDKLLDECDERTI